MKARNRIRILARHVIVIPRARLSAPRNLVRVTVTRIEVGVGEPSPSLAELAEHAIAIEGIADQLTVLTLRCGNVVNARAPTMVVIPPRALLMSGALVLHLVRRCVATRAVERVV